MTQLTTTNYTLTPPAAQLALLLQSYNALKESIYGALVLQTRLKPYLDSIALTVDENGVGFDTSGLVAMINANRQVNERDALLDLVDLQRFAGSAFRSVDFDSVSLLGDWIERLPADSPLLADLKDAGLVLASATSGAAGADSYFGNAAANVSAEAMATMQCLAVLAMTR